MRDLTLLLLGGLMSGAAVLGQTPQAPVFRGGVTLVPVDVSVVDRDGKPVPGLTADDFEVKLDGHVQPVRAVAYEELGHPSAAPGVGPPTSQPLRETTNLAPPVEPRLFVLMLDDLSMAPSRGKGMFFAATRFVDQLPLSDVVGFTLSSGTATLNPTRNRPAVDAALRHTAGDFIDPRNTPPHVRVNISDALEIVSGVQSVLEQVIRDDCFGGRTVSQSERFESQCAEDVTRKARAVGDVARQIAGRQIAAYLNVINAMKDAPGLKELVVISDGIGVASREQMPIFQPIARAAAAAGVRLSVLSQDPDMIDLSSSGRAYFADNRNLVFDLMTMTDMAGGTFYRVMGQPDRFFDAVAVATSAVYHLGVEPPADSAAGRDFVLIARVKRSGVTVHANRVALAPAAPIVVPVEDQLEEAVARGLPNYGVPVTVATVIRRGDASGQLDLDANLEVPASASGPLTVMYGLLDAAGQLRTGRKMIETPSDGGTYRVSLSLPVAPGIYRLRFAIADATGHVGSIDAPVTAELGHVGPFFTSDVMTSWSGADSKPQFLALEEVPPTAVSLRTYLELYPAPDAPMPTDIRVQWSVIGSTTQPVAEQSVVPVQGTDRLTAAGQFPLDTLASGTYEIRATVLVAGRAIGAVSTTFRKADKGRLLTSAPHYPSRRISKRFAAVARRAGHQQAPSRDTPSNAPAVAYVTGSRGVTPKSWLRSR
jgi:VWFA-related protein